MLLLLLLQLKVNTQNYKRNYEQLMVPANPDPFVKVHLLVFLYNNHYLAALLHLVFYL